MTDKAKESLVSIKGVNFSINGNDILRDIHIELGKGEFIGLVGPNGAGKTTLLKAINGINKIDTGDIFLSGKKLADMSSRDIAKKVSFMSQNTFLTYALTSEDVVLMGRYPHLGRFERESKKDYNIVREYMNYTDTQKLSQKFITEISGGEKQRVLFAKALAQEAEILLLDEPTASLDITHQEQIFRYAVELADDGKLVVAAVHDLRIAARYCSRLILLRDGTVIDDGEVEKVFTPKNLKAAYDVDALVYKNSVSGMPDFYIHKFNAEKTGRVHVVGGGGSASGVIRLLFESGYKVSAGVFSPGDSDYEIARNFGVNCVTCKPFSEIDDAAFKKNVEMIGSSDLVILCNMPFGMQNMRNLLACMHAKKLIIIEDEKPEDRDYTGGKGIEVYNSLKSLAVVTNAVMFRDFI